MFSLVTGLFTFAYEDFGLLIWVLVLASALLALLFVLIGGMDGKVFQLALGFFIFVAIGLSIPVGLYTEAAYARDFWLLDTGAKYREVSPAAPSASYLDASAVEFQPGSFVDVQRSLGMLRLGSAFCVAPVVGGGLGLSTGGLAGGTPGFWAVGEDCCGHRGSFTCGDVDIAGAHAGVIVDDVEGDYMKAVRMAVSNHELKPVMTATNPPLFLRWTKDVPAYQDRLWVQAMSVVVATSGLFLAVTLCAALVLGRCLQR